MRLRGLQHGSNKGVKRQQKQYQEAMNFEMDFVIGFGTVWGRYRSKKVLADGCLWKTLSRRNLGRVTVSGPIFSGRGPPNHQDRNQIPGPDLRI